MIRDGIRAANGAIQSHGRNEAASAKNTRQINTASPAARRLHAAQNGQMSRNWPMATRRANLRNVFGSGTDGSAIVAPHFGSSVHHLRHLKQMLGSEKTETIPKGKG